MLDLQKTTDLVKYELERDLYLLEVLKDGLVNVSALARKFLPIIQQENPKATIESVSIAIKRYVDSTKKQKISQAVARIIANSQLSTKNDVAHITFHRNDYVIQQINEISRNIKWDNDEIFFINQGSGEVTVILDKKNKKLLNKCNRHKIESTENLTVISVREIFKEGVEKSIDIPGIYAYFVNQLARRSINIVSVISTYSQITFAVKNKDFVKAYETLQGCIEYFRNKNGEGQ